MQSPWQKTRSGAKTCCCGFEIPPSTKSDQFHRTSKSAFPTSIKPTKKHARTHLSWPKDRGITLMCFDVGRTRTYAPEGN